MAKKSITKCLIKSHAVLVAVVLVLIFGMLLGLANLAVAQRPSCDTSETTVEFLDETCNGSTCTWSYNVCQTGFALSHWVLGLCDCFEDLLTAQGAEVGYIDADGNKTVMPPCPGEPGEPCWEFGLDPTTGLFGLKWDNLPGPENECWTFYLTIDQDVAQDNNVNWTSKFAACDPDGGTVTGPACSCDCVKLLAFKYYDVNQNETYDYEQNGEDNPIGDYELEGWEICLYDEEEEEIECLWTDEMGFVDFGCLPPGDYKVCENLPDGWINSQPGNGNGSDPPCYTETLQAGQQVRLHFGNYEAEPLKSYIRAGKYYDYDGNGQCDDACCPLNDWEICLYDANGLIGCKTTHDYCMLCGGCTDYWEVGPGTYTLCEKPKNGWVNSDPGVIPHCKVVGVTEAGEFFCVRFGNWETPVLDGQGDDEDCGTSAVGGKVYPVNKVSVLAPWLILTAIIAIFGTIVVMKRRTSSQE